METSSSIISALGAGSGIDMVQLANDLAGIQFQARQDRLTSKSESLAEKISLASTLKNGLSTLASSFGDRVRDGDLASVPSVANGSVAGASSPFGTVGSGSYSLEVSQLAQRQVLSSPAQASAEDVIGAGTLTIRFGANDGASFTADASQDPLDITIGSGSSLNDIAGAINAASSDVSAYVAQTVNGAQLVIKGPEGEQSGFVLEASETLGEEGLAALAWEPTTGAPAQLLEQSQDALFELDGLEFSSASNDTDQIAPGLQLELTGTNVGAPTEITFSDPSSGISSIMVDMIGALNEIVSSLNAATAIETGELRGDSGARALKRQFSELASQVIMPTAAEGAPSTFSDIGLKLERDGSFTFDLERLQESIARDPDAVAAMFGTGIHGVYSSIDSFSRDVGLSSDPSSLGGSINRYERQASEVSEKTTELAEKQETLRVNLVSRYAKVQTRLTASQSTLSFLEAQIAAWNSRDN